MQRVTKQETAEECFEALRILYVEDDSNDRLLMKRSLEKNLGSKFVLSIAESGIIGLDRIAKESFDLVLLDHRLPQMTGLEFLDELNKMSVEVPVIFVTGKGDERVAVEAMKRGVRDYILKGEIGSRPFIESINKIFFEVVVPKDLDIEVVKQVLSVLSASSCMQLNVFTEMRSAKDGRIITPEMLKTLNSLAQLKYITIKPLGSALACPSCGSLSSNVALRCPDCKSGQLRKGFALKHLDCGHMDFDFNFDNGKDLVCPKCRSEVHGLGVDYQKLGSWYRCVEGHFCSSPVLGLICSVCESKFSLDTAQLETLNEYSLSEKGNVFSDSIVRNHGDCGPTQ